MTSDNTRTGRAAPVGVVEYSPMDPRAWPAVIAARLYGGVELVHSESVSREQEHCEPPGGEEVRGDGARHLTRDPAVRIVDDAGAGWRDIANSLWREHRDTDPEQEWFVWAIVRDVIAGVYDIAAADDGPARDALRRVFYARLGWFDQILVGRRYLGGDSLSEADAYLFGVLLTFDIGYRSFFPFADAAIVDYPHLWRYARDIYAHAGVVTEADKRALGLAARVDGTFAEPWGAFAWTETVEDLRAAWNA